MPGVPFNEADGFGDFQMIDPSIARYTEVYKGGNALRFGGALLGGAEVEVRTEGGSIDLSFTAAPRRLVANAAAGDVSLRVPAGT